MTNSDEDERCCGTGTCLIDVQGRCWCGQQWNGSEMCRPETSAPASVLASTEAPGAVTMDRANG